MKYYTEDKVLAGVEVEFDRYALDACITDRVQSKDSGTPKYVRTVPYVAPYDWGDDPDYIRMVKEKTRNVNATSRFSLAIGSRRFDMSRRQLDSCIREAGTCHIN
jgi:hypothetical protein